MAGELRWILLAICVPLLLGVWWWSARRSRQAPGHAELREIAPPPDAVSETVGGAREWGVSPFEPLSIRTAEFEPAELDDLPMSAHPPAVATTTVPTSTTPMAAAAPAPAPAPAPAAERSDGANAGRDSQHIVGVRVVAVGETRWRGTTLKATLEAHGLAFGRYQVFHRRHSDGRSLFSAASLVEPGTFNPSRMAEEDFPGLTLFAILPGPAEPLQTFDAMIQTAMDLAEALHGAVQDDRGVPLCPQRVMALRADVVRFQTLPTLD